MWRLKDFFSKSNKLLWGWGSGQITPSPLPSSRCSCMLSSRTCYHWSDICHIEWGWKLSFSDGWSDSPELFFTPFHQQSFSSLGDWYQISWRSRLCSPRRHGRPRVSRPRRGSDVRKAPGPTRFRIQGHTPDQKLMMLNGKLRQG